MNFNRTNDYIKQKVEELKLPYISCIVKKDGKEIYSFDFKKDDKNNDILNMYSMSKPITCVAFMQLVEKGLVSLDDNLSDYLPGFDNLFNIKTHEKYDTPIKIWNLLSMTSGLDYGLGRKSIIEFAKNNPNGNTLETCSTFALDGLQFEPSKGYQYSLSLDVVAALIEKITGVKFSTYVKENVFDKLGMKESTFEHNEELASKARDEYFPSQKPDELDKLNRKLYKNFFPTNEYESGGAGLISTVKDYSLFADSIACKKNEILDDKTVDEIATIRVEDTPFDESVQEFSKSNVDYGYGLAVRVRKHDSAENIPCGEFGWDGACGSYSLMDRKNKISIVIGLTIGNWPAYVKDLHIAIVKSIYKDIFKDLQS